MLNTVQFGYCDSDLTVCLLFWNMPILQDGDVKFPRSDKDIIYKHFNLKATVSQWLNRSTTVGVLVWKTRGRRLESWHVFLFVFFVCVFIFCLI